MDLIHKVRLYQDNGRYFAVLVASDTMYSSTGRTIAEALENLGRSMADHSAVPSADCGMDQKDGQGESQMAEPLPDAPEVRRRAPLVKQRLDERFGKATLRELSDKLGLDNVTPQLLSSSIAGRGAKRVRLAIAAALGEDPNTLWPAGRH
jgi:lambda repressor-like predicted transcriptional regulator